MPIVQKRFRTQSALRVPLNRILGTETNVRILRTLFQLGVAVGTSELARQVEMDKAGVWRAIKVLEEFGIIESVGLGLTTDPSTSGSLPTDTTPQSRF